MAEAGNTMRVIGIMATTTNIADAEMIADTVAKGIAETAMTKVTEMVMVVETETATATGMTTKQRK